MTDNITTDQNEAESPAQYWAEAVADKVLAAHPNNKTYVLASGISPSGVVHFGNFRDVMTSYAVLKVLRARGKDAHFLFFWDDFDRFRKVPKNISEEFQSYIGMPLSQVPDPIGEYPSYAKRFEIELEQAVAEMDIDLEFVSQTTAYQQGTYDNLIVSALQHRREIGQILLDAMSDKAKSEKEINELEYLESYYPVSVYSRFSGKDSTEITAYDGAYSLTYRCLETGKTETIDIRSNHIVKLAWKIDWPMRWRYYDVVFEPGGMDHATPGSSFDVSSKIAEQVFGAKAPEFVGYQFIGIRGFKGKMSSSKGDAIAPSWLLEIYEPYLLKWLYLRRSPDQSFSLAFDNEVYRQYDEIDQEARSYFAGTLPQGRKIALESSLGDSGQKLIENPIPFRQAVGLGQIVQWDEEKMLELLKASGESFDEPSVRTRLKKARAWLETYNQDQAISLRDSVNTDYVVTMDGASKENIQKLRSALSSATQTIEELNTLVYGIPKKEGLDDKENAVHQKAFFKDVYSLLISKDAGPRLSTFLWAVSREKVLGLLDIS